MTGKELLANEARLTLLESAVGQLLNMAGMQQVFLDSNAALIADLRGQGIQTEELGLIRVLEAIKELRAP